MNDRAPSTTEPSATAPPSVRDWLSLIRFSHSVFALPFALAALLVATDGRPPLLLLVQIVLAMVFARSAAMAWNRYVDRDIDAKNPRTAGREIPSGRIRPGAALVFTLAMAAGFVATAAWIQPLCGWLAVPTLGVLLGYSHAKRFTSFAHVWLGAALGLAAPAAWLAARGTFGPDLVAPSVLGLGVTAWVAGFDVLYACQDEDFDRAAGLRSLPARLGRRGAMLAARGLHALAVVGFAAFGALAGLGAIYFVGVGAVAVLLVHEHRLVRPDDLGRIDMAFFTMNGIVGLAMLGFVAADVYVG